MNFKKVLAGVAAGAMAASMSLSAFASTTYDTTYPVVLDGTEATAAKMVQYDLSSFNLADGAAITTITITATAPFTSEGWVGGGGGVGFNAGADGSDWVQIDFDMDSEFVTVDGDNITIVLDFSTLVSEMDYTADDSILQIGWWWGAGNTLTISDIQVDYAAAASSETSDSEESDTSPVEGDTTPVAYLAAVVALAGVALVGSKKARA